MTTQNNAINAANQTATTTQKEMGSMKKGAVITRFKMIESKEVFNTKTGKNETFPAQIRLEIRNGEKAQVVAFGFTRLGGRSTYLVKKDQEPKKMALAAFIKQMRDGKVQGLDAILPKISELKSVYTKDVVVAKCECCGKPNVTAAEVDFIQRHHERLSKKLNREVTAFSRICMTCQNGKPAPRQVKKEEAVATCASCDAGIFSKRVADYSLSTYGATLCFGKCQNDAKALMAEQKEEQDDMAVRCDETVRDMLNLSPDEDMGWTEEEGERISEGASASSVEELVIEEENSAFTKNIPTAADRKRIRDAQDAQSKKEIMAALREMDEEMAYDASTQELPFPEVDMKAPAAPVKEKKTEKPVTESLREEVPFEEDPLSQEQLDAILAQDAATLDFLEI